MKTIYVQGLSVSIGYGFYIQLFPSALVRAADYNVSSSLDFTGPLAHRLREIP